MALGADDEQTARLADLDRFVGDLRLELCQRVGVLLPGVQNFFIIGLGIAGGLGDQLVGHAGFAQDRLSQILGVAAQHDIGTAPGHVGGDGDGAQLAGLGDDLGFLFVVLGVQNVVGDALLAQKPR
ncbi:hypothetical protein SDC9_124103 [bioreactor metagenome]|uniref:Uncharacterized protein n=1 Tax=bioreactor metagenome TaxID=1076179 RepID=A0A645CJK7_9ZZZZ